MQEMTSGFNIFAFWVLVVVLVSVVLYHKRASRQQEIDKERNLIAAKQEAEASRERESFAREMAKMGYVQQAVLKSEDVEEETEWDDDSNECPRKSVTREWQLAWVKTTA